MVLVDGEFVPSVGHACIDWIDARRDRCRTYKPPALTGGKPEHKRFCVDRYEYPNLPGVRPAVMPDWHDAREACEAEDKRLCLSSEWTLACEGPAKTPYPYGYARDPEACNIDRPRPSPEPDFDAFSMPRKISAEVDRLDLRVASGERSGCVSGFGVHDMTGNVDEWVVNEAHFAPLPPDKEEKDRPYVSGLKGGYWGPIRARCRPMTTAHNEWFRFYQVGFRCCRDPLDGRAQGRKTPRLPRRTGLPSLLPR
jgi:formylglycine-generating enzyme